MNADIYAAQSFEEFWPHYVRLHTRPETQIVHALATVSCVSLLSAALVLRQPLLLLAAPLADYAIAQASHRLFEANATTPWKSPAWHARAELRMLRLLLTGRMKREVERVDQRAMASFGRTSAPRADQDELGTLVVEERRIERGKPTPFQNAPL